LRCGRGGAGVFVITDSWSWIRAEGFQTREHTNTPPPLLPDHCTECIRRTNTASLPDFIDT
ncbi:hypothetical protein ACQQ61_11175, partial [Corynebacterium diphtheriae]